MPVHTDDPCAAFFAILCPFVFAFQDIRVARMPELRAIRAAQRRCCNGRVLFRGLRGRLDNRGHAPLALSLPRDPYEQSEATAGCEGQSRPGEAVLQA